MPSRVPTSRRRFQSPVSNNRCYLNTISVPLQRTPNLAFTTATFNQPILLSAVRLPAAAFRKARNRRSRLIFFFSTSTVLDARRHGDQAAAESE